MTTLLLLPLVVLGATDPVPADDDVKAGWVAFAVFIALAVAVALLGFSLVRHLRKADANAEAGAFGDTATDDSSTEHHTTAG